jgi:hypothetical protein
VKDHAMNLGLVVVAVAMGKQFDTQSVGLAFAFTMAVVWPLLCFYFDLKATRDQ